MADLFSGLGGLMKGLSSLMPQDSQIQRFSMLIMN